MHGVPPVSEYLFNIKLNNNNDNNDILIMIIIMIKKSTVDMAGVQHCEQWDKT